MQFLSRLKVPVPAAAVRRPLEPVVNRPVFSSSSRKPSKTTMPPSGEVEPVKVHDFVPRRYEIVQELLQGVLARVDFRQCPELGVRTEDQVDNGCRST